MAIEKFKDKPPSGCPVNLYGYIKNNINNIDYVAFEEKGYFIGSGATESGKKRLTIEEVADDGQEIERREDSCAGGWQSRAPMRIIPVRKRV
jgi:hypothetical protein